MAYIEFRRRRYYGMHDIPERLHDVFGKRRFFASLGTDSRSEAKRRLIPLEMQWRRMIAEADTGNADTLVGHYEAWRRTIAGARTGHERDVAKGLLEDELESKVYKAAERAGVDYADDVAIAELPEYEETFDAYQYATGQKIALGAYVDAYLALPGKSQKTAYQVRRQILRWAETLPYVDEVTPEAVQAEIERRVHAGNKPATVSRDLSMMRNYWVYLTRNGHAPEKFAPFDDRYVPRQTYDPAEGRRPFASGQAVELLRAAKAKAGGKDQVLIDAIRLAMFTGARRSELSGLTVDDVNNGFLYIRKSKTKAGVRTIPIHPKLQATVERLCRDTPDGYLLPGLKTTRNGDRGDDLGKRFGTLKRAKGYGPEHVFHSFRHTVVTLLENAGVTPWLVADVVGHEKEHFTFQRYSGGSSAAPRVDAIGKLDYPELTDDDMR